MPVLTRRVYVDAIYAGHARHVNEHDSRVNADADDDALKPKHARYALHARNDANDARNEPDARYARNAAQRHVCPSSIPPASREEPDQAICRRIGFPHHRVRIDDILQLVR